MSRTAAGRIVDFFHFHQRVVFQFCGGSYPHAGKLQHEPRTLKALLLAQGTVQLANVVEKTIQLRDFKGAQATGSYFRLTDKKWALVSPPESEAKYLTQGCASVGPLVLSFRLLSNHPAIQESAALEVIKTARYSETNPPGTTSR